MTLDVTDSTAKPKVSDPACLKPTVGPWEMFAWLLDGIGRSCCGKDISCHYYMPFSMSVAFRSALLNIHQSSVLTVLFGCYMAGATRKCCRLGARSVYKSLVIIICHSQ